MNIVIHWSHPSSLILHWPMKQLEISKKPTGRNEMTRPEFHAPEGDEAGVAERRDEKGQDEFRHLCASVHVPPPDLRQQGLQGKYRDKFQTEMGGGNRKNQ